MLSPSKEEKTNSFASPEIARKDGLLPFESFGSLFFRLSTPCVSFHTAADFPARLSLLTRFSLSRNWGTALSLLVFHHKRNCDIIFPLICMWVPRNNFCLLVLKRHFSTCFPLCIIICDFGLGNFVQNSFYSRSLLRKTCSQHTNCSDELIKS